MEWPLVSVICLSYNHERFIDEAVQSVLTQSYPTIELIIVDDASKDLSQQKINHIASKNSNIRTLLLNQNVGNCKAFNQGLALAKGEYIIDLAADDVLMPERISKQVVFFEKLGNAYGVVFTDAIYIDERGEFIRNHYDFLYSKGLLKQVPQGDIFSSVVSRYFIASPTMIIRKSILHLLNGYDEELSFEDFDFWIRSSRICLYGFLNEKLTAIRLSKSSMSKGWYKPGDKQVHSTYLVCCKLIKMIKNDEEKRSLLTRVRYEFRHCTFSHNKKEALLFFELLKELSGVRMVDKLTLAVLKSRVPVSWILNMYHHFRFS